MAQSHGQEIGLQGVLRQRGRELAALASVDRYAERDLYVATVAKLLAGRTLASLAAPFDEQGVWWARVSSFDQLRDDPQLKHNDTFRTVPVGDSEVTLVNHPIRYDGKAPALRQDARVFILDEPSAVLGDAELVNPGRLVTAADKKAKCNKAQHFCR